MAKKFNKGQVKIQDFGTEKRAVLDNIRPLLFHGPHKVTNWHERAAFQRSAFGRSTAGNDIVA